ncbi:hypothetical protein DRP05_15020, partial [Archaeoglobales archaeon]
RRFEEHDRKFNEILERLDEHSRRFEEHDRKFNEILERLDEHDRKFTEIVEELKLHREKLEEHDLKFDTLIRRLDALGSRWGIMSEKAFREGLKEILKEYFDARVEKWIYNDKEGFVFGYPSIVDVDIVVKNGEHLLVEIKSHVSKSDVGVLLRKGKLYEKVNNIKPKLAFLTPYIDVDAKEDAKRLGISIYSI